MMRHVGSAWGEKMSAEEGAMTRHMPLRVQNGPIPQRGEPKTTSRVILVLGVAGAVAFSLILATWQHVEALRYGYRLNQLARERERLEALKRQLESERAYYRSPQVIEPLARRLGLIRPDPSQVIVVGRGGTSPAAGDPMLLEETGREAPLHVSTSRAEPPIEGPRTARRRLRARPMRSGGERVGEGPSAAPAGSHAEMSGASEAAEHANDSSPKVARPDAGASSEEKSDERAAELSTPKRRRPSKQGEP
jgi:hypothetical protein